MSRGTRRRLLRELEALRGSRLLVYITGDRQGFETKIAGDVVRLLLRHLEAIGEVSAIDLFLYSRGGTTTVPWRLVNLIREYAERFSVIVPFKAHSAATMICLGADEVVMTKMAELAPVDPSTANPFNPEDPGTQQKIEISVEDMAAYLDLIADRTGVDDAEGKSAAFLKLAESVHPLALGHAHRAYLGIRQFCRKLLDQRRGQPVPDDQAQELIDALTAKLYAHNYPISRVEAKELGLEFATVPDSSLESAIWALFAEYETYLHLTEPFEPVQLLGSDDRVPLRMSSAIIETSDTTDEYVREGEIRRVKQTPPGAPEGLVVETGAIHMAFQGWRKTR